jgi:hypothetical protein
VSLCARSCDETRTIAQEKELTLHCVRLKQRREAPLHRTASCGPAVA